MACLVLGRAGLEVYMTKICVVTFGLVGLVACGGSDGGTTSGGSVTRGQAAWTTRNCAGCHGAEGSGTTTPLSDTVTHFKDTVAYSSNLTPDKDTGLGRAIWTDAFIIRSLRTGVDDANKPICEPMPVYKDMSDQEAADIVAFLRSLPPVKKDIPESACPSQPGAG
jgi:cytochrome c